MILIERRDDLWENGYDIYLGFEFIFFNMEFSVLIFVIIYILCIKLYEYVNDVFFNWVLKMI